MLYGYLVLKIVTFSRNMYVCPSDRVFERLTRERNYLTYQRKKVYIA
jgi:hypothetical protein